MNEQEILQARVMAQAAVERLVSILERLVQKETGLPVKYDPATGEFVVVSCQDDRQVSND